MRIAASIALNDESSVTQLLTYIGIEVLWQLKSKEKRKGQPFLTPQYHDDKKEKKVSKRMIPDWGTFHNGSDYTQDIQLYVKNP